MNQRVLCLFFLLLSCSEVKQQTAPKQQPKATSAPSTKTSQNIALEAPDGDTALDQELKALQQKIARRADQADLWELLGRAWIKKARESQQPQLYARANSAAEESLRLQPKKNLGALELLGLVLQNEHRFQDLEAFTKKMLAQDPKNPDAWALAGDAALELGQYARAVEAYQQMIDLRPGLAAYARVAYLRWLVGDIEGSLQMWDEATAVGFNKNAEQTAYCFSEKANVLWLAGDLDGAKKNYQSALTLLPNYAPALIGNAKLKFAQGDTKGAQTDLTTAMKVHPGVDGYHWLAAMAKLNQDEATTKEAYAQLEILGRQGDFRTLSVHYSTMNQNPEVALSLAKKDAEQRGGVYTYDALAFAYFRNKNLPEAKKLIDLALSQGTKDPMLLAHAGLIYQALGETALAQEKIQAALKLNAFFDPILNQELSQ